MLPEVISRKCLVKNAMRESDDLSSDLMPTIRVSGTSGMSNLLQRLPKPAYPDLNNEPPPSPVGDLG